MGQEWAGVKDGGGGGVMGGGGGGQGGDSNSKTLFCNDCNSLGSVKPNKWSFLSYWHTEMKHK